MATNVQVRCNNKLDRPNPHERITHIGRVGADGKRWRREQQQAIHDVESGIYAYWVSVGGKSASPLETDPAWRPVHDQERRTGAQQD